MFKIRYVPSTSHWIVPPIVLGILVILLAVMFIKRLIVASKKGESAVNLRGYSFFEKNWDKVKLIGTLLLFIGYILAMDLIGFLGASIIFITLFNLLFAGKEKISGAIEGIKNKENLKNKNISSVFNSILISVLFSAGIWFLFGKVFRITLP